jgi:hypothetical protein
MDHATTYLHSARHQFTYYKTLGERTFAQLGDEHLLWRADAEANSIAIIVQHLHGNMRSRWTALLTSDGEKEWRQRDLEFEEVIGDRAMLLARWEEGWQCVFDALDTLDPGNFDSTVYIRAQAHTVTDAVNRQLCHYAYHVGQIVLLGRMLKGSTWCSLSIPRGNSARLNQEKFTRGLHGGHFSEEEK